MPSVSSEGPPGNDLSQAGAINKITAREATTINRGIGIICRSEQVCCVQRERPWARSKTADERVMLHSTTVLVHHNPVHSDQDPSADLTYRGGRGCEKGCGRAVAVGER